MSGVVPRGGLPRGGVAALLLSASLSVLPAPRWQVSASQQIGLSIRDKNPSGRYAVTFVVTDPDGKTMSVTRQVDGDPWGGVVFPADFATDLKPGRYRWHGCVDHVQAIGGQFSYAVKGGSESLTSSTRWPGPNSPC